MKLLRIIGLALGALVAAWAIATLMSLVAAQEQARVDRDAIYDALAEERADSEALRAQVRALGEEPVVEDATPEIRYIPVPGPRGRDGKDGEDGRDGADGESITGPRGPAGRDGESITGPPGERGRDGATGAQGPAGPAGASGADGRGIESVGCESAIPFTLTFTYTDGAAATVECGPTISPPEPAE